MHHVEPGQPDVGNCITQVWSPGLSQNVPLQNPLGAGATPAFSPTTEYNLRARYDWQMNDYKMFFMVGAQHVGDMQNEPSSFQSGYGVTVPSTTWLRYDQPAYTTYDAAFNVAKDQWSASVFGTTSATPTRACSPRPRSSSSRRCRCGRGCSA